MRARPLLVTAAVLAILGPSVPAGAVSYSATIDVPGSVARGTVVVKAHVSGGVGNAEHAAYQVGSGGPWVAMDRGGDGQFEARRSPWATEGLPNGGYRLEVRIWGDVPVYDPGDPNTYANQAITVGVDNAPPAPVGLTASPSGSSVALSWEAPPTAGRSDFAGYRVLRKRSTSCPGSSGYVAVAETSAPALLTGVTPGTYCYKVVALRSSVVSGVIASAPTAPAKVVVRAAGGPGAVTGAPGS